MRDLFVVSYGIKQSRETTSLSVKITALWALKVPLEEVCRFGHHIPGLGANVRRLLSHADNHWRHVPGRRLHAQLSLRDILTMALESRSCHNMIPPSVKNRTHVVSSCTPGAALSTLPTKFLPITDGDFLHEVRGRPTRVDAPLLTVDESFRTCCQ